MGHFSGRTGKTCGWEVENIRYTFEAPNWDRWDAATDVMPEYRRYRRHFLETPAFRESS